PQPFQALRCDDADIMIAIEAIRQAPVLASAEPEPVPMLDAAPNVQENGVQSAVAPVIAVETPGNAGDISQDARSMPVDALLQRVSHISGVSEAQKRDMIILAKANVPRRQISIQVLGGCGRKFTTTKEILDTAGIPASQ
ncbi:MAG: hypothetical protein M3220_05990, partial [Chloroflexota bacterium]|nr:hypothetical protein [Chloroflexota bacterium]